MKKALQNTLTILTLLVLTISLNAQQQGISYKAMLKDASGNVLSSAPVSIQFIISDANTNNVYQESHTIDTDPNGLVIVNIGEGITADIFADINWASDDHFLNVQVSTGSGLVDLGTTEFMAVPYAKHANTSGDTKWVEGTTANDITNNNTGTTEIAGTLQIQATANIDEFSIDGTLTDNSDTAIPTEKAVKTYVDANSSSGLEAIDEGNGIGWRLKGRSSEDYGNIGLNAIDLSYNSIAASSTQGATGNYSTAMGYYSTASGDYSTAMGYYSTAPGNYSTAMGYFSFPSGDFSTAMGAYTAASGDYSTAMGLATTAEAYASSAIGNYNIGGGDPFNWVATDPLFEIGNGSSSGTLSNALTVYKNGNTTINGDLGLNTDTQINSQTDFTILSKSTGDFGGMYIDSENVTSGRPFYGYAIDGIPQAYHYFDRNDLKWKLSVGSLDRIVVDDTGNVGIGFSAPEEKLVVKGRMRLEIASTNPAPLDGTIVFNGANFFARINNLWYKMTDATGGLKTASNDVKVSLLEAENQKIKKQLIDLEKRMLFLEAKGNSKRE